MKLKIFLTIALVLLSTFTGQAQDNPKPEPAKTPQAKLTAKDYEDLLARLKGGDTKIDFTALRMAFTETKDYSYGGPDKAEKEKFLKPFNDKNYKEALKQAEKFLEKNYVEANAHYVAYNSAKELKDDKKADPLVVSVTLDKKLWIETNNYEEADLPVKLGEEFKKQPGRKILLKGDEKLTFGDVRKVMDKLRTAGAKGVGLGVEEVGKK